MRSKTRKVMIVGSEICDDLEAHFAGDGWAVSRVYDGTAAVSRVRREAFDLAVLISTGKEMDVTETLFNLRDIRDSMTVVVVSQPTDPIKRPRGKSFLPPDAKVLAARGLDALVRLLGSTGRAG